MELMLVDSRNDRSAREANEPVYFRDLERNLLIFKIIEVQNDFYVAARHFFMNVVSHIKNKNPNVQLYIKGINSLKEVKDGQLVGDDEESEDKRYNHQA